MLIPKSKITIIKESGEQYVFDFVTEWETEESVDALTDTAKVTFPRAINLEGVNLFAGENPLINRGDQLRIEAGYFPEMRVIFEGWITEIKAKIPVEIYAEDDMWLLKNTKVNYPDKSRLTTIYRSKKNGRLLKRPKVIAAESTLGQLLDFILPDDIAYEAVDRNLNLGSFRVEESSVTKVLEYLKDNYGLHSRFRGGVLYVGFRSNAADTNTEIFEFENNIISDEDLEYKRAEDISLRVVVKSIDSANNKLEVAEGDPDGSVRTYHLYGSDEASMREYAQKQLTKIRYTGYVGTFETFGEPYVRAGDVAQLVSKKLPERNGNYLIPTVKRKSGMQGYRQIIEIDTQV